MSYLLDTNVLSEVRKGERCHPAVARWWESVPEDSVFLSALTVGEIRKGIDRVRARDSHKAQALDLWLATVQSIYRERILPIDAEVAETWGVLNAVRSLAIIDSLMAATAQVYGLTLVTRNVNHVEGLGVPLLNPFEPASSLGLTEGT